MGIQAKFPIAENVVGGLSVSYQSCSEGFYISGTDYNGYSYTLETSINLNLIPVMAGISYEYHINKNLSFIPGIYMGYGFLIGSGFNRRMSEDPAVTPYYSSESSSGDGFVFDISVEFRYKVLDNISLSLRFGYRNANIFNVRTEENYMLWSADFSGFSVSMSGTVRF